METLNSTVLVCGASSQIGAFSIPLLLEQGYRVFALSRQVQAEQSMANGRLSWMNPGALEAERRFASVDQILSCGPLKLALQCLQQSPAAKQVVVFSTSSVYTREAALRETYLGQEDQLRSLCRERSVSLVIFRPTLIYGCGMDRNISVLSQLAIHRGWVPVARASGGLRQPVHAADLARAAVNALVEGAGDDWEGEICGGETLTYSEMAARIAALHNARMVRIPTIGFKAAVGLLSWFPRWKDLRADMVDRQALDFVFDGEPARKRFQVEPRKFQPEQSDFKLPKPVRSLRPDELSV